MSRLDTLYQQLILDHNKSPRNFGKLDPYTHYSKGINPLCGDQYEVTVVVKGEMILDIQFSGTGCAISKSSGSLMTDAIKGKSVSDALGLKDLFLGMILDTLPDVDRQSLGRLAVLEGVKKFPARVKCAALVWRAFEDAVSEQKLGQTTTE